MLAVLLVIAATQQADVPLPRPRPSIPQVPAVAIETPHGPVTDCDRRLGAMAVFDMRPSVEGPGQCGGTDLLSIRTVLLPGGRPVAIEPPALLRCEMAESLAAWVRDEVAPRVDGTGSELRAVRQADAYTCRNRDNAKSGRISEHAHGNALDIAAFVTADKGSVAPTDVNASKDLREALRETACRRFTTVLGPGEPAHDTHIHLDVLERRRGYRICSWDVRDPPTHVVARAETKPLTDGKGIRPRSAEVVVSIVLPPPRPHRRHR